MSVVAAPLSLAVDYILRILRHFRYRQKKAEIKMPSEECHQEEKCRREGNRVGSLVFYDFPRIHKGRSSSIFEGSHAGRSVVVKRLQQSDYELVEQEFNTLMANPHHNILGYYCVEYDRHFIYIGMEQAACCNLFNFFFKPSISNSEDILHQLWKPNNYPSLHLLKLMRDIVSGLAHLHQLGIVHHDLRPHHVLVCKDQKSSSYLCAKLSNTSIRRQYRRQPISEYRRQIWRAPEHQLDLDDQLYRGEWCATPKEYWHEHQTGDMFSLGRLLFFCITGGKHPYGNGSTIKSELDAIINIKKHRKDLSLIKNIPEAVDLISRLLNPKPNMRPQAVEVLEHPLFWTSDQRLSFLRDACDHILELENSKLFNALENTPAVTLVGKWDEEEADSELTFLESIASTTGSASYKFDTALDLLRLIRNSFTYHAQLPQQTRELVGSLPEALDDYFSSKFPKLFFEVYNLFRKYCKDEAFFQKYKIKGAA